MACSVRTCYRAVKKSPQLLNEISALLLYSTTCMSGLCFSFTFRLSQSFPLSFQLLTYAVRNIFFISLSFAYTFPMETERTLFMYMYMWVLRSEMSSQQQIGVYIEKDPAFIITFILSFVISLQFFSIFGAKVDWRHYRFEQKILTPMMTVDFTFIFVTALAWIFAFHLLLLKILCFAFYYAFPLSHPDGSRTASVRLYSSLLDAFKEFLS